MDLNPFREPSRACGSCANVIGSRIGTDGAGWSEMIIGGVRIKGLDILTSRLEWKVALDMGLPNVGRPPSKIPKTPKTPTRSSDEGRGRVDYRGFLLNLISGRWPRLFWVANIKGQWTSFGMDDAAYAYLFNRYAPKALKPTALVKKAVRFGVRKTLLKPTPRFAPTGTRLSAGGLIGSTFMVGGGLALHILTNPVATEILGTVTDLNRFSRPESCVEGLGCAV